jgi:hypothetical protein
MAKVLICQYLLGEEYYCRREEAPHNYKRCSHTYPHNKERGRCLQETCSDNYCEWVDEETVKPYIFRAMIEGKI